MPSVNFQHAIEVRSPASQVWATLTDVEQVVSWVTVLDQVTVHRPLERYGAVLADRMGPFKLRADLDIDVTDVLPYRGLSVAASGEDRQVASRIVVAARLELDENEGGCRVRVNGTYEVAGRVATLGAATINKKADRILAEFFGSAQEVLS